MIATVRLCGQWLRVTKLNPHYTPYIHDLSPGTLWSPTHDRPHWASEEPEACGLPEDIGG